MRPLATVFVLLTAATLVAKDKSPLERAVEQFGSADPTRRHEASRTATAEVRKLLAPLLAASQSADPEIRRRARAALRMIVPTQPAKAVPSWHPMKAAGPPDAVAALDHPNAWASKIANQGIQWLELGYRTPMRVSRIRIYEVNSAGAVTEVITIDDKGKRRTVWKGKDPTRVPGVFELKLAPTAYKVAGIRINLDTNRRNGWNEIDAVEIVGPGGRAWAATATASSTYAR